jgi:hypothetical protein
MKSRWVLHPTLIAAAFVLEVALANKIEPAGFARSLTIAILLGIGLTLLCWAIARDRWVGGLIALTLVLASISIVPFFIVSDALRGLVGPAAVAVMLGLALFATFTIPLVQWMRVRRGATPVRGQATFVLNRFAAMLVVVVVVFHVGPDVPGLLANTVSPREKLSVSPVADLPDIYVILLDGYPRTDVLRRRFGIDNAAFLRALGDLGFDVGIDNHSNYTFTQLTLASMFQMRQLADVPELAPLIDQPGGHVNAMRDALIDSPGFATLRAAGYQIVVTQPGYEHVALRAAADRVLEQGEMNDLERDVLKRTWLLDPLGALMPTLYTQSPRDRIVHAFDDLAQLPTEERTEPIFAWIHVPAPHLPLVIDADGRPLELGVRRFDAHDAQGFGMTKAQFAGAYAGEISYLDARVLTAVRALQAPSEQPAPVILVMSDHGYGHDFADVQARLSNLFAAYTPRAPGLFNDTKTLVNVLPTLFNRFLGTDFPRSADQFFLSPSVTDLLELTEVSNPG